MMAPCNRLVTVSPNVCVLLSNGYDGTRRSLAKRMGIAPAKLRRLNGAAQSFADALADALGVPADIRTTETPDWWGDGDFEPDCKLGLPTGWTIDDWVAWCKERFPVDDEEPRVKKVPVSKRALVQRINRKLAKRGERLCASPGPSARQTFGAFFVVNGKGACRPGDLLALARQLGALQPHEYLEKTP